MRYLRPEPLLPPSTKTWVKGSGEPALELYRNIFTNYVERSSTIRDDPMAGQPRNPIGQVDWQTQDLVLEHPDMQSSADRCLCGLVALATITPL